MPPRTTAIHGHISILVEIPILVRSLWKVLLPRTSVRIQRRTERNAISLWLSILPILLRSRWKVFLPRTSVRIQQRTERNAISLWLSILLTRFLLSKASRSVDSGVNRGIFIVSFWLNFCPWTSLPSSMHGIRLTTIVGYCRIIRIFKTLPCEKSTLPTHQNEKNQNRQNLSNKYKNSPVYELKKIMLISAINIEQLFLEREILHFLDFLIFLPTLRAQ